MGVFSLNTLDLTPENGIYITKPPTFKPDAKYEANSAWGGIKVDITNIQPRETRITLSGYCYNRAALRKLHIYSIQNYNWNTDPADVYLTEDISRRWKIRSMVVSNTFEFSDTYGFEIEMVTNTPTEGMVDQSLSGTAEGYTDVTGFLSNGDQDTNFDYITITGKYFNGSNLQNAFITMAGTNYHIEVAEELLDTAELLFSKDYTVKHTYEDELATSTLFDRNKDATLTTSGVNFSTDRIVIPSGDTLTYKFALTHPLIQDPLLTLSAENITGSPILEVSGDALSWWVPDKALVAKNLINYSLSKLAGSSTFYWRIRTTGGATVSSPTLATTLTSGAGGTLEDNTTYYIAVAAGNSNGTASLSNILSQTTGSTSKTWTGGVDPATDMTSSSNTKFKIRANGDTEYHEVTCVWTGCSTGTSVAAQMQTKVRAIETVTDYKYDEIIVQYSSAEDHYLFIGDTLVEIAAGDTNDCTTELKISSGLGSYSHTHSITLTIPQVTGATFYDIFCSTDAQPLKVGTISESQRAAGDYKISTSGSNAVTGGKNAAGTVLICTVGTGSTGVTTPASIEITYMSLESWHTFSGQKPIPYLRSETSETMTIDMTAGACDYEFGYHDSWTF